MEYARVLAARRGTRCGSPDSLELDVENGAAERLKVIVYLEQRNGSWQKQPDGTSGGLAAGQTMNFYTCHSTGRYKVIAMSGAASVANRCPYPDYHGY